MKIGIHINGAFNQKWIEYCKLNHINYKLVDCHKTDIIQQLSDCDALMWHFNHADSYEFLFAKQLMYSVEISGKLVFPNYNTMWYFDDKIAQKYLFESIEAPVVSTNIFYTKHAAKNWIRTAEFPKVFKLRGGAGSHNVKLIKSQAQASKIINQAFGNGFRSYSAFLDLKERYRKLIGGQASLLHVVKGVGRLVFPPKNVRFRNREKRYVYFQDFIAGNNHDYRIIVVENKAFAIQRSNRENDFRASGSGIIQYDKSLFENELIKLSFEISDNLKSQCVAFDFIKKDGKPVLLEVSFGFAIDGYLKCEGFWDKELNWYEGSFNPYGWMVDNLVEKYKNHKSEMELSF